MQKVYVVTRAKPMGGNYYVTVKATKKEAEKVIRGLYPNARKSSISEELDSYACKNRDGSWLIMCVHTVAI